LTFVAGGGTSSGLRASPIREESPIRATLNQTACQIREVAYLLPVTPCDQCQQPARRVSTADRVAIDLDLDQPTLLLVTVGVHHCPACRHYFRCQPPFLRPDACYTNRVVAAAVAAVHRDGMAMRRVPARLARDFWVRPSERSVRLWCRAYQATCDFATDYQPWVVAEFSGVLCVDELYQGELALLLAADPAAPDGDRLVGYQLVHGAVDAAVVGAFLARLQRAGIQPAQVITDGSPLYPRVLTRVWPTAAHQLCLFHEARRVTRAVLEVRSHEVPFAIEDGQVVGRLAYERLTVTPDRLYGVNMRSNYQRQGLRLSKHFRQPPIVPATTG
jgi:bacterioferritin-associated ferredoxin